MPVQRRNEEWGPFLNAGMAFLSNVGVLPYISGSIRNYQLIIIN